MDLKLSLRTLSKNPGFTLLVVLLLALGIGANTAMFSILDAWLIQPLPFPHAERLAIILKSEIKTPTEPKIFPGFRDLEEWASHNRSFENISGAMWRSFELNDGRDNAFGMIATGNLFDTLEWKPQLGRTFRAEDVDGPPVAVISNEFWKNRLGSPANVLGTTISLSGRNHQIIGVMPPGFGIRMINQGIDPQIFALIQKDEPAYVSGAQGPIAAIGRLKPGISAETAQQDLGALQRALDERNPDNPKGYTVLVTNLQKDNTRNLRASLWLASAAVGFILLIVCANVGSLLLGRTLERQREMAIRSALGAGQWRIVKQLLTESLALAAVSAVVGLLLAYGAVRLFQSVNPFGRTPVHAIGIDTRALIFTVAACVLSALIFGLAPALQAARTDLNDVMKATGRSIAAGRGAFRARAFLVAGQIALSLVLVVGAALFFETLTSLQTQPLGFRTEGVTVSGVTIPKDRWNNLVSRQLIYDRLVANLEAIPGVKAAAVSNSTPVGGGFEDRFSIEGQPEPSEESAPKAGRYSVTSGYFPALDIPVLAGRGLDRRDDNSPYKVVVVNQTAARRWFPNGNAIGARVKFPKEAEWRTVVGVVGDTSYSFFNTLEWLHGPAIFVPSKQNVNERVSPVSRQVYAIVQGSGITTDRMRSVLQDTDPALRMDRVQRLQDLVDEVVSQPRLRTQSVGAFAALSLLLAAIGIYGVVSQSVIQQRQEIGIRMALGARRTDIVRMVVGRGLRLAVAGIVVGIIAAAMSTRVLAALLYGVKSTDPATYAAAILMLLTAVFLAALLPARTASRVDPMSALRDE